MNFIPESPTKSGLFLWKKRPEDSFYHYYEVTDLEAAKKLGGVWCQLVAADECLPLEKVMSDFVPKSMFIEEVERTYWESAEEFGILRGPIDSAWNNSRAKRVVEGKE